MNTVFEILSAARRDLMDEDARYWTNADLLVGLNAGEAALYKLKPAVYESTETVTLAAGHRQALPNGADVLFNCIDNVSHRSRRAITVMNRELLDRARPRWRSEAQRDWTDHYDYVETEPQVFEVYPPAQAGTKIRISYARPPAAKVAADIGSSAATSYQFSARVAKFADALLDYVMYQARIKEMDANPDMGNLAQQHLSAFAAKVTGEGTGRTNATPNATSPGGRVPTTTA